MNWVLVDTDVISFEAKKDTRADLYRPILNKHVCCVSIMTLAELRVWTIRKKWGDARITELQNSINNYIVLDLNRHVALIWAEITTDVEKKGRHISSSDAWIAATAPYFNIPLVTHNYKDYEAVPKLNLVSMNKK